LNTVYVHAPQMHVQYTAEVQVTRWNCFVASRVACHQSPYLISRMTVHLVSVISMYLL